MSTPFLSEIRMITFGFPPKGWAFCNGQMLLISQNQALFALLGTTFGGDGVTTFAVPDLRGRAPLHDGGALTLGQSGGQENQTLIVAQLPSHTHVASGSTSGPTTGPLGSTWATLATPAYAGAANTLMNPVSTAFSGGGQSHSNMPPFLALHMVIALQGIFPSQS